MASYQYGRFTAQDAHDLQLKVVTITTHADPETGQPGETYGPNAALYVDSKPYLMLLPADYHTFEQPEPEAVVFLDYVAQVELV